MTETSIHVIVDATSESSLIELFHIPLWERCLRLAATSGLRYSTVLLSESTKQKCHRRKDFGKFHDLRCEFKVIDGPIGEALSRLAQPGMTYVLMAGDAVYQDSLVKAIAAPTEFFRYLDSSTPTPGLFKIGGEQLARVSGWTLPDVERQLAVAGELRERDISKMSAYVPSQRKEIRPYMFRVTTTKEAHAAERFVFEVTHYGSLDFVAKHLYKEISKLFVTWLCRTTITPNQVTYVSIVFAVAVIPLFFLGYMTAGLVCGIIVSFLDVLDGKLARFTYRMSDKGDALDHVADRLNIVTYYLGFGLGLYTGSYTSSLETAMWLAGLSFVGQHIDKSVVRTFRLRIGIRLDEHKKADVWVRLIRPGRNVLLCFIAIGLLFDRLVDTFIVYTILIYLVGFYHMIRLKMEWDRTPVFHFPVQGQTLGALRQE